MEQSSFLKLANSKYHSDKEPNYELSLEDFICDSYLRFPPSCYGMYICKKIQLDLYNRHIESNEINSLKYQSFYTVPDNLEKGDLVQNEVYYEVKVSFYSSTTKKYTLRHLRPWQDFQYYLLCLIDCEDNFKPNFYVINKDDIHLCVPSTRTARIQETHLVLLHGLCDGVDHVLYD